MNFDITKAKKSKISNVDFSNLGFCKYYSDHMFVSDYENGKWKNFRITPFQDLNISPACTALHYGQTIFEGLKAYKNWQKMKEPKWANVTYKPIDYQALSYYAAPKKKSKKSLDEVDPEILETYN